MNPDLEKLVRLHQVDSDLRRVESELAVIPRHRQEIDDRLARDRSHLEAAKAALEGSQKARKQNEASVQDLETKRSKYKGQLMEVKTNKEYTAMLHEIETVKEERGGIETRILQAMDMADTLEGSIKRMESALSEEQLRVSAGLAQLKQEEQEALDRKASLEGDRSRAEGELPPELVSEFARVSRARGGVAVARVVVGLCQGCSVRIQPRIFQQVRRNEGILRCDSCRRFLYYIEEKVDEPPPGP